MTQSEPRLTLVIGFRDRDPARVERCLDSLDRQTRPDFELLFVDYGSRTAVANAVRPLVETHSFARYVYSDTRGQPWARARALNIGMRRAASPCLLATDVDMVFDPGFVETVLEHAASDRVLYCAARFLPRGFDRWEQLGALRDSLLPAPRSAFGGCQCANAALLTRIRGFDERYRYWGAEDRDLAGRLASLGLHEVWLEDRTAIYHQWHPRRDFKTGGVLPAGEWARMERHLIQHRERVERNPGGWGEVQATEDRPILRFADPETGGLHQPDRIEVFDAPVHSEQASGELIRRLWDLPEGRALGVLGSSLPRRRPSVDLLIRFANRALAAFSPGTALAYRPNLVHEILATTVEEDRARFSDYYLDFPALGGVSLVTRGGQ